MPKKKYTPIELMNLAILESYKSIPEHIDKLDPLVGAIITDTEGEILATAHRGELRIGEHCEYTLIERKLKDQNLSNCTLYVTLEPCIDEVRNQPKRGCSTHIIKSRISTVYIGMRDPNPKIENEGVKFLIEKGIKVIDFPAHLEAVIRESNASFIKEKELEQMQLKVVKSEKPITYLQKPMLSSNINEFDEHTVKQFLQFSGATFSYPSEDFNQWSISFEITNKDYQGNLNPTRLGLILFGKNVENIYPQTLFKVEIDYGNNNIEIKDFGGPIVNQLSQILLYIKDKALKLTINRSQGIREINVDFPPEILREAIANAIIHRDYENEGSTNYLYISSEKIVVRSPGNPEKPLTLEDFRSFDTPSISRNPKIMFVFNKMKLAEQRGIGLRNMKKLSELGFPLPIFELKAQMFQITFGRTPNFLPNFKGVESTKISAEDKLGLLFIQENKEISVSDYSNHFKLEIKTANRRLNSLVKKGLIVQIGENKGTKYLFKH